MDDFNQLEQLEEFQAQKEELTAAIEELVAKNRHLEEVLQKLKQRNTELDNLLYRASHDLKTPVSSLQGLLNLAEQEVASASVKQLHGFMTAKVSQMNDIVKSMSMLSEASFADITFKPVNFDELMKQVLKDLIYLPNFSNVSLTYQLPELQSYYSDELLISNILKSLISNSITFRDPLKAGYVNVLFKSTPSSLMIEVHDDGEGIDPAIAANIFDMFFRGSERSHGIGLGLYIVKIAIERLNGTINWGCTEGKTIFRIGLPLVPASEIR